VCHWAVTASRIRCQRVAWERTPWHATQMAAWDALKKASPSGVEGLIPVRQEAE